MAAGKPQMTAQEESRERGAYVALMMIGAILLGVVLWIAHVRLHFTNEQLAEMCAWPGLGILFAVSVIRYYATKEQRRQEIWPKARPIVSDLRDRQYFDEAVKDSKTLVGYRDNGEPFFWSNDMRTMQTICFGKSGSGKSVLLYSVGKQDILRGCPVIIIDAKGDQKMFQEFLPVIDAAGRTHQLRIIDPMHPEYSSRYNPLYVPEGVTPEEQVALVFESFQMNSNSFFDSHQKVYLENIVRILHYSKKRFNFHDVLVTAYDLEVLKRQVKIAIENAKTANVSVHQRQALEMSVHHLQGSFEDQERVAKIQGLLNQLMTFMADEMAQITGGYEDILTLDDVIDNKLILYLSLNANVNAKAVTALGRIVLQNLQLMIGRRYSLSNHDTQHNFVSVLMDEFAPFAYAEFANIINTARGSNVAFFFAMQNQQQLLKVNEAFRSDLASSPNTTFMLRISDDATAKDFLASSGKIRKIKRSVRYEKRGIFNPIYDELDEGTASEVEETAARDQHLKYQPTGQMEVLMVDHTRGATLEHIHVRRDPQALLVEVPMTAHYPALVRPKELSEGLNLTFITQPFKNDNTRNRRTKGGR